MSRSEPTVESIGSAKKTLLIVDAHPIMRRGLAALVESEPDLVVCGGVGSRMAALEAMRRQEPDLYKGDHFPADCTTEVEIQISGQTLLNFRTQRPSPLPHRGCPAGRNGALPPRGGRWREALDEGARAGRSDRACVQTTKDRLDHAVAALQNPCDYRLRPITRLRDYGDP